MKLPVIAPIVAVALLASPALAKKKMADQFTGTLVSMTAPGAMGSRVQIWIEAYTADDVAASLVKTLSEQGQQAVLNAVTDYRAGTIRIGTSNGYPIAVARERKADDGSRTIILATNRPFVGFAPAAGTRIEDYPFGIIELKLAADGTGEGTLVGAAQISFDPEAKRLGIKTYATQPSRLTGVQPVK